MGPLVTIYPENIQYTKVKVEEIAATEPLDG